MTRATPAAPPRPNPTGSGAKMTLGKRHPFGCFSLQYSLSWSPSPTPARMHPQNTGRTKMGKKAQELDFPSVGESPAAPAPLEAEFQSPLGPRRACSLGLRLLCHAHPLTLSSHLRDMLLLCRPLPGVSLEPRPLTLPPSSLHGCLKDAPHPGPRYPSAPRELSPSSPPQETHPPRGAGKALRLVLDSPLPSLTPTPTPTPSPSVRPSALPSEDIQGDTTVLRAPQSPLSC